MMPVFHQKLEVLVKIFKCDAIESNVKGMELDFWKQRFMYIASVMWKACTQF